MPSITNKKNHKKSPSDISQKKIQQQQQPPSADAGSQPAVVAEQKVAAPPAEQSLVNPGKAATGADKTATSEADLTKGDLQAVDPSSGGPTNPLDVPAASADKSSKKAAQTAAKKKQNRSQVNNSTSLPADGLAEESTQDWADMAAEEEEQQQQQQQQAASAPSAKAEAGSARPPLTEAQLAKKARQKAKLQEKKAAKKAAAAASQVAESRGTAPPPAPTTQSQAALENKADNQAAATTTQTTTESQAKDSTSDAASRSAFATQRGRGRGSGFARGFAPVSFRGRGGRGFHSGRGGFGHVPFQGLAHRRPLAQQVKQAAQPVIEWPNGIAPPTMPRAQREELERKRQAAEAAAAAAEAEAAVTTTKDAPTETTNAIAAPPTTAAPVSVGSESVPSRSGTATPATTAASSSPAAAASLEDRKEDSNGVQSTQHAGHFNSQAGSGFGRGRGRGRGGFFGFRGRGYGIVGQGRGGFAGYHGKAHAQPASSRLQFGSVPGGSGEPPVSSTTEAPPDRRQEAVSLAAEQGTCEDGVRVRLPTAARAAPADGVVSPAAPSEAPAAGGPGGQFPLPAGFAVDGSSLVWDLRFGQPHQVGVWSDPHVRAFLDQCAAEAQTMASEPVPAHMRALFGQASPRPGSVPTPVASKRNSHLPASAAKAAAFKPTVRTATPALSEESYGMDPHDPTAQYPYDGPAPYPDFGGYMLPSEHGVAEGHEYPSHYHGHPSHQHAQHHQHHHHHHHPSMYYPGPPMPYYDGQGGPYAQPPPPPPHHDGFVPYPGGEAAHPHMYHQHYQTQPPYTHAHAHAPSFDHGYEYATGYESGMTPYEYYDPQTGAALSEFDPSIGEQQHLPAGAAVSPRPHQEAGSTDPASDPAPAPASATPAVAVA